jgi:hypothetical protein
MKEVASWSHSFCRDLVIARVGIQKREDSAPRCEINYLVYARQRERILRTRLVKVSIVNTHSPFPILIFYKDEIGKLVGVIHFLDETSCQELGDLLAYGPAPLLIKIAQALVHGLGTRPDAELVLSDLPRDAWHVRGLPCEVITIGVQEVDERTFLFGQELGLDPQCLGQVVGVDLDHLGILGQVKGAGRGWLITVGSVLHHRLAKPLKLGGIGNDGGELEVLVATVICLFDGAAHHDDIVQSWHLQLEVGVVGDHNELGVARMPEDGVV